MACTKKLNPSKVVDIFVNRDQLPLIKPWLSSIQQMNSKYVNLAYNSQEAAIAVRRPVLVVRLNTGQVIPIVTS